MSWFGLFKDKPEERKMPCVLDGVTQYRVPSVYSTKKGWPLLILEDTHYHILADDLNIMMMGRSRGQFPGVPNGVYMLEEFSSLEEFVVTDDK